MRVSMNALKEKVVHRGFFYIFKVSKTETQKPFTPNESL